MLGLHFAALLPSDHLQLHAEKAPAQPVNRQPCKPLSNPNLEMPTAAPRFQHEPWSPVASAAPNKTRKVKYT